MLKEFRDFIAKGNVIMIAVGLMLALYFQTIVDAVLNGVINPLIAAIFGENNFTKIGFNIGDPPRPVRVPAVVTRTSRLVSSSTPSISFVASRSSSSWSSRPTTMAAAG